MFHWLEQMYLLSSLWSWVTALPVCAVCLYTAEGGVAPSFTELHSRVKPVGQNELLKIPVVFQEEPLVRTESFTSLGRQTLGFLFPDSSITYKGSIMCVIFESVTLYAVFYVIIIYVNQNACACINIHQWALVVCLCTFVHMYKYISVNHIWCMGVSWDPPVFCQTLFNNWTDLESAVPPELCQ